MSENIRIESDFLGKMEIPKNAYYGINTARAIKNFHITGRKLGDEHPELIVAFAYIKKACAKANQDLAGLDSKKVDAICKACDEIIEGRFMNEFKIDVVQGGAGTSTNMALNEIIANRALEIMGHEKGEYDIINPNDDVNKSQSTNDTYPAALKLTTKHSFGQLTHEIESLIDAFEELAAKNKDIELMGMTQLRNAVKMSYYDLFHGYAASLKGALENIKNSLEDMNEIALGGTAIGTGIGAPKGFGEKAVEYLNSFTTFKFAYSTEAVSIISDPGDFATVSSALKQFAIRIGKITDDIRLLASSRFGNITIPAKQLGSSIMPGKINPVIPEAMNAVSMVVLGNDNMISNCLQSGQLQLNPFVPLIAHKLLDSSSCLKNAIALFEKECVRGIKVNAVPDFKNNDDTDYLTHLVDKIGYKAATQIRVEAEKKGVSPSQIAREKGLE